VGKGDHVNTTEKITEAIIVTNEEVDAEVKQLSYRLGHMEMRQFKYAYLGWQ
jgi:hypothetical protein